MADDKPDAPQIFTVGDDDEDTLDTPHICVPHAV